MERLKSWDGKRLTRMCGQCHGNGDDIDPNNTMLTSQTNRFMAYGLMRSRCFTESGNHLSCITCHDAHGNTTTANSANSTVSTASTAYEAICLSCHTVPGSTPARTSNPPVADVRGTSTTSAPVGDSQKTLSSTAEFHAKTVCKVNPRTGCIGCHMPTTEIFPGLGLPTKMADHYIRIRTDSSTPK